MAFEWQTLVELEPELHAIERDIERVSADEIQTEGIDRIWAFQLKPQMERLVGWYRNDARDSVLCSSNAYTSAYEHLYGLLENRSRAERRRAA